ncbi:hypothetical protein EBZ80_02185 [bacterium]|nr:hypothetical protein [bacterium]
MLVALPERLTTVAPAALERGIYRLVHHAAPPRTDADAVFAETMPTLRLGYDLVQQTRQQKTIVAVSLKDLLPQQQKNPRQSKQQQQAVRPIITLQQWMEM